MFFAEVEWNLTKGIEGFSKSLKMVDQNQDRQRDNREQLRENPAYYCNFLRIFLKYIKEMQCQEQFVENLCIELKFFIERVTREIYINQGSDFYF